MSTPTVCRQCGASPATGVYSLCIPCSMQDFPSLPAVSAPPTGDYRICGRCGNQVHNSIVTCGSCGYAELALVELPVPSLPSKPQQAETAINVPNPCWTCAQCGYGYNMQGKCDKCQGEKPAQASAVPAPPAAQPNPCWTCQCGYEYNMQDKCTRCQREKYPQASAVPVAQPNSYWTCQCGQGYNAQDKCANCGVEKNPQAPAPFTQQPNSYWKCETCNYEYNTGGYCEQCAYNAQSQKQEAAATYWICQNCGSTNNQSSVCFQCATSKDSLLGPSSVTYSAQTDPQQPVDQTTYSYFNQSDPGTYYQAPESDGSAYQQMTDSAPAAATWTGQSWQQGSETAPLQRNQSAPYSQEQQLSQSGSVQQAENTQLTNSDSKAKSFHCPACGSLFDTCDGCATCKSKSSKQPVSPPTQPEEQKREEKPSWKCWECGTSNLEIYSVCKKCATGRKFYLFLERHKMKLSADKTKWICKCKQAYPLNNEVCTKCGMINDLIRAGKKGEGHKIGVLTSNLRKP